MNEIYEPIVKASELRSYNWWQKQIRAVPEPATVGGVVVLVVGS